MMIEYPNKTDVHVSERKKKLNHMAAFVAVPFFMVVLATRLIMMPFIILFVKN